MKDKTIAVYAGSFDPFTNGHLSMVRQAAGIFDELIIVIADNFNKKRHYDSLRMRDAILYCLISEGLIVNCSVVTSEYMTVDACSAWGAQYLVRGIRSTSDFLYEEDIAKINKRLNPDIKTVYLRAEDDALSSSMVRELLAFNKDISTYVPSSVLNLIEKEGERFES